jgi:hypothetical protein
LFGASTNPGKLIVTGYTDEKFTQLARLKPNPMAVWINPSSYSRSIHVQNSDRQAQGSPGPSPEFNRIDSDISFDLVFDATGVIPAPTGQSYANGVTDVLAQFTSLVAEVNGTIHKPNFLIIGWGDLQFQCLLSSLKIDYTLFRPDGVPLRAKVSVSFTSFSSEAALEKEAGKESPDMTHIVTVTAGDTLPLLSFRIYGDSGYYMKLARYNGLPSFRTLTPGTQLLFPPLSGLSP